MSWAQRAARNLLPLSREQSDLAVALREWRYEGGFHDLEAPNEDCELCDHPDIRYQFEIRNRFTDTRLQIGSECINRFGISATSDDGEDLDAAGTRKKVSRDRRALIEEARKKRLITALVALSQADPEFRILSFIDYLQDRGAFTPKQLVTLLWRFEKVRVPVDVRDFTLTIRRDREKVQLLEMADWQIGRLMPAMSPSQRQFLAEAKKLKE
ncbi:hypothetical protein GCM10011505_49980 [Tistrella bauzanensis]|jgi:hypothetical protein|uniref:Uncharacterized protein n=1 Tax=Tistrella bauzanensis TaxID=657419 RepID=A0ABQ1JD15_9PROT|nr:hypothetical protein [Tistrella bauzanensis]TAM97462.1 MAG: hypothetical protein EPN45_19205 [Rhizobiaceae bacterium]GGB63406.1 hypothetical protein GCM10011505_49980 [Tistrella bauzanensis]